MVVVTEAEGQPRRFEFVNGKESMLSSVGQK